MALKQEDLDFVNQIHLGSGHANAHGVEWQFDSGGSWTTMPSEVSSVIHDIHEGYRQGSGLHAARQVGRRQILSAADTRDQRPQGGQQGSYCSMRLRP